VGPERRSGASGTPSPNGWAIAALALAVVAFLIGLMPGVGFVLAVPGGAVAALLAFPALARSERTGRGRGMAWSALALALVAMFVSYSLALLTAVA
jgi:crotonobetainyl-CoA:carnitine CoA-transferase CaiB-like acyl-CoA transferase